MNTSRNSRNRHQAPNSSERKVQPNGASVSDTLTLVGTVTEAVPGGKFRVRFPNGHEVLGYLSGKVRVNLINVYPGDKVKVEVSPDNLNEGRIVFRLSSKPRSLDAKSGKTR